MLFTNEEIQECMDYKGFRHFCVESRFWSNDNCFSRRNIYHSMFLVLPKKYIFSSSVLEEY